MTHSTAFVSHENDGLIDTLRSDLVGSVETNTVKTEFADTVKILDTVKSEIIGTLNDGVIDSFDREIIDTIESQFMETQQVNSWRILTICPIFG